MDKIEDMEFLCTIFELIYSSIPKKMNRLHDFVGSELYQYYYKISSEICDNNGDLDNAIRYLNQCKIISKGIGIKDN
jgi:hypothetical protein